jgi:hypothetical protein
VRGLNIIDETLNPSRERHAIFSADTKDINIEGLKGTQRIQDGKLANIYLKDSKNVLIKGCQANPGNGSFLRLEGNDMENVNVIGNDLSRVNTAFEFESNTLKKVLYKAANRLH